MLLTSFFSWHFVNDEWYFKNLQNEWKDWERLQKDITTWYSIKLSHYDLNLHQALMYHLAGLGETKIFLIYYLETESTAYTLSSYWYSVEQSFQHLDMREREQVQKVYAKQSYREILCRPYPYSLLSIPMTEQNIFIALQITNKVHRSCQELYLACLGGSLWLDTNRGRPLVWSPSEWWSWKSHWHPREHTSGMVRAQAYDSGEANLFHSTVKKGGAN